ncbi:MAG: hypothetical protein IRZ11_00360 [Clostridia bacterium]|nr:hypothetical protein [Clostridia bacterium]
MAFAWIVVLVTAIFFGRVLPRARRSAPHNAFWALSLAMACLAALAYVVAVYAGSAFAFRVYYLLGAMLMAAYMGLGSVWLAWGRRRRPAVRAVTGLVVAVSLIGAVAIFLAPIDASRLRGLAGDPGTGVILASGGAGALWLAATIALNSFGAAALVGVAILSAFRALAARKAGTAADPFALGSAALGNSCIAVGGLLEAAAGSAARLGLPGIFWLVLALGWVAIYWGFELVTRAYAVSARETAEASAPRG